MLPDMEYTSTYAGDADVSHAADESSAIKQLNARGAHKCRNTGNFVVFFCSLAFYSYICLALAALALTDRSTPIHRALVLLFFFFIRLRPSTAKHTSGGARQKQKSFA